MKLITWNIQWGRGADGRVDLDRIVEHARRFADFDVLCLQEVSAGYSDLPGCDGSDQFHGLADRLRGYTYIAGPAMDVPGSSGERRLFGNMIFSRYPVLQVFRHLLPWPAEPGVRSMQRAALEATLDTPLGLVRVITTHLEYYSAPQRMAQVERLRDLHREGVMHALMRQPDNDAVGPFSVLPRAAAAILAGDFNFSADSAERTKLLAPIDEKTLAYCDAWEVAHPGKPNEPTVGVFDKEHWPGPPFVSDFIFASENLKPFIKSVRVDPTSDASDHQPMLLELDYGALPA
jgi:endonuclease/exonuclease/phosphatase family metal-dependent hydrolase